MDLKNLKVLVVGLGITGTATAKFLVKRGANVVANDIKSPSELREQVKELEALGVRIELGKHNSGIFSGTDLIILSPGVPSGLEFVTEARKRGIKIISEIELAFQHTPVPIIAVTGTNGKSTTVSLLGEIFAASNKKIFVGGNLGTPLIEMVDSGNIYEYAIVEVSSYQLEWIDRFRPFIGAILNITEDHLDRYPDFQSYVDTKKRIFLNQRRADFSILNADDPTTGEIIKKLRSRVFLFSSRDKLRKGAHLEGERIKYVLGDVTREIDIRGIQLIGKHNLENIMACVIIAQLCGCDEDKMIHAIEGFKGLPHRIQFVRELRGVRFYDDSKATNVHAVCRSLECFKERVILIAGGKDKGGDYGPLKKYVSERVKTAVLLGDARDKIMKALTGRTEVILAEDMKDAVEKAANLAEPGDVVLLSPACSSFDMFANYAERGQAFCESVRGLA